ARVVGANKGSYAHVDVEELDVHGKQSWGMRTSALLAPGLCTLDIGSQHPGIRRLQLRLIIGGPNEGARVGYSYVRFIRRQDLPWLNRNKDWQRVEWVR
ncbi:MAG TPA: hypothetical protein VEX38_10970, partial [Fimbriimonadaceae bacterium]|nr:hypothetical protein [Fimbriimonadaceae bacterium]